MVTEATRHKITFVSRHKKKHLKIQSVMILFLKFNQDGFVPSLAVSKSFQVGLSRDID